MENSNPLSVLSGQQALKLDVSLDKQDIITLAIAMFAAMLLANIVAKHI